MPELLPDYAQPHYRRFVNELTASGFADRLRHYRGRNFYEGPAVDIDRGEEQDVIRATTVRLQSDQLGRGLILYPTESPRIPTAAPPPYDPWSDVREALNLLRQPDPDLAPVIGLLQGALEAVEYLRDREDAATREPSGPDVPAVPTDAF